MTTYTLDASKLNYAVSILDMELEALQSTAKVFSDANGAASKIIFRLFLLGVLVVGIILNHGLISVGVAGIVIIILYVALVAPALLSGFRSIRAFIRLRRLQRDLRLDRMKWLVGWREFGVRLLRLLPMYFGIAVFFVSLYYRTRYEDEYVYIWVCDIGMISMICGFMLAVRLLEDRWLLPIQNKIADNQRLRSNFVGIRESLRGSSERELVSIPEMEYKQISKIEKALVFLDQKRTIKESAAVPQSSGCPIQQSTRILRKKADLKPSTWLRVQRRIDELSSNPRPTDARKDADGTWWVTVPETSHEVQYTIAEDPQRVMVHDLFERGEGVQ